MEVEDAELDRLWQEFRDSYESLGYRRISFEYFASWLKKAAPGLSEISAEVMEQGVYERSGIRTRGGMDDHACGFVHDEQVIVLESDVERGCLVQNSTQDVEGYFTRPINLWLRF